MWSNSPRSLPGPTLTVDSALLPYSELVRLI
jgi:hypothetical protein